MDEENTKDQEIGEEYKERGIKESMVKQRLCYKLNWGIVLCTEGGLSSTLLKKRLIIVKKRPSYANIAKQN